MCLTGETLLGIVPDKPQAESIDPRNTTHGARSRWWTAAAGRLTCRHGVIRSGTSRQWMTGSPVAGRQSRQRRRVQDRCVRTPATVLTAAQPRLQAYWLAISATDVCQPEGLSFCRVAHFLVFIDPICCFGLSFKRCVLLAHVQLFPKALLFPYVRFRLETN